MPRSGATPIPHIERIDEFDVWVANGKPLGKPGYTRWPASTASCPTAPDTYDDIAPGDVRRRRRGSRSWTSRASTPRCSTRTSAASATAYFLRLGDRELVARLRARLQRLPRPTGARAAPDRLLPDHRAAVLGRRRRGRRAPPLRRATATARVNFCNQPQDYGQPPLGHRHWDPIWAAAQEAGVPVSFHVGGGRWARSWRDAARDGLRCQLRQGVVAASSSTTCAASPT